MASVSAPPAVRLCADGCGRPVELPHARYADPCRAQRRRKRLKYTPTPEIDRLITEAYDRFRKFGNRTAIASTAKQIGWPKWRVNRRAIALGLAQAKEAPWSADELAILERYGWMSDNKLSDRLKAAGFTRTATAVHLKKKRSRIRQNANWYSATQLAEAFGVDSHKVTTWIRSGLLRGTRRGTDRTERQGGDAYLILHRDVRTFALTHIDQYDLAKVEKRWYLDLITGRELATEEDELMEPTLP